MHSIRYPLFPLLNGLPLNDSGQIRHICSSITFILPMIPIDILTYDIELQPRVVV